MEDDRPPIDSYALLFWAAPAAPDRVVEQTSEVASPRLSNRSPTRWWSSTATAPSPWRTARSSSCCYLRRRVDRRAHRAPGARGPARRAPREADRLKDEFLAAVSHELRTPLTALVGFSSLLLRVFERFVQLPKTQAPGSNGTGVGLAIVTRFVDLLSGRVWIEREPKYGSTFLVALPAP